MNVFLGIILLHMNGGIEMAWTTAAYPSAQDCHDGVLDVIKENSNRFMALQVQHPGMHISTVCMDLSKEIASAEKAR
jgi:hypothetical protein